MNTQEQIRKERQSIEKKINEIMLVIEMTSIHLDQKNEVQLLEVLKGFQEINKNLLTCFEDGYKEDL